MSATDVAADAELLVREAHEAGYRYPPSFPGFRAALHFRAAGLEARGRLILRAGESPEVEVELPEGEERWLAHELASLARHRFHSAYEDADGRSRKLLHEEDGSPLGRLVAIEDAMDSSYRIGGEGINEITRTHGGSRFTIVIQQRVKAPDGRLVSSAFTVCHRDAESGRLLRADAYSDTFIERDDLFLPARRRVVTASDTGLTVRELELSSHELLEEETR